MGQIQEIGPLHKSWETLARLKNELEAIEERIEANHDDFLSAAGPDSMTGYFETADFGKGLPLDMRLLLQIAKDTGRAEVLEGICVGLELALLDAECLDAEE